MVARLSAHSSILTKDGVYLGGSTFDHEGLGLAELNGKDSVTIGLRFSCRLNRGSYVISSTISGEVRDNKDHLLLKHDIAVDVVSEGPQEPTGPIDFGFESAPDARS